MSTSNPKASTYHADATALVHELVQQVRATLGANLVAIYLYGSLVTGDFDPNISDVDLLAVTVHQLNTDEFAALDAIHEQASTRYPAWHDRIEIAYLDQAALKTFRTQSSPIAIISPGEPFHIKEAGRDWLINWWVVRRQGRALFGPPPSVLIDPISDGEFLAAVRDQAEEWRTYVYHMERRGSQAYAILTLCRALYATVNREQVSKQQAAAWAMTALPEWSALIQDALHWRVAGSEEGVDDQATLETTVRFVNAVADRVTGKAR